jgi:hypothetical protein
MQLLNMLLSIEHEDVNPVWMMNYFVYHRYHTYKIQL